MSPSMPMSRMQEEHRLILMFARLVDVWRKADEGTEERKAALEAVCEHVDRQSACIRLWDGRLTVEGLGAPQDVPFVRTLMHLMDAHDVVEIRLSFRAAPVDVLALARALATPPTDKSVRERLNLTQATTVSVHAVAEVEAARERRKSGVAGAFATPERADAGTTDDQVEGNEERLPEDFVTAEKGAAYGQMIELTVASSTTLAAAVHRLKGHPDGNELSKGLNAVAAGITKSVREKRGPEAIDVLIAVIKQEEEERHEDIRLRYGVALRRMLQSEVLQPLIPYLLDPLYARDVALIMRRAGERGTQILLDLLVEAPTFAERRAYMQALEHTDAGTEMLVGMLDHHEWFVVRNVADLAGEMKLVSAIPALGKAGEHEDHRVRLSAGLALSKIGTPAVMKYLGALLRDPHPTVRWEIAKNVGGKELRPLAMPLVNAAASEEEEEIRSEMFRALGRVGSDNAVSALIKASEPVGLLKGRRTAAQRAAAAEGLVAAGGERAIDALRVLAADRDKHVRAVALKGLEELTSLEAE